MQDELKKIDLVRERMGISYREAREILEASGWDLVEALVKAEENKAKGWGNILYEAGEEIAGQVKTYFNKGNRTKIKLKRGEKTIVEFPATVGVLGIVAALASTELAVAAGIGTVAAIAKKVSLEIEKPDGETKVISLDRHREERRE